MIRARWLAAILVLFTWTLTTHGKYSASGDEPHYLMITHSLVVDHDLDLANDYADNAGRFFGHPDLAMGLHAVPSRTGRILSIHDIGVGVLLVPPYLVAQTIARWPSDALLRRVRMDRGLFAYSIIGLFLIAMTTGGMLLLAAGLTPLAGPARAAPFVLAAGLSPPIVSHAFLVFPEVFALFFTCAVVWLSLKRPDARDVEWLMAVALMLGVLPWLHHKYFLYVPALAFVVLWHRWPLARELPAPAAAAAAALLVLPQAALVAWSWHEWGAAGGAIATRGLPFSVGAFEAGAVGLWIDRQAGLIAYAPLYSILAACCIVAWKRAWPFLVAAATLYVPAAAFTGGWWAGFAPAARYLVPALPLLLVPMADALRFRAIRVAFVALCLPQAIIDAVIWQHPRSLWPAARGNPALEWLGAPGRAYESFLPAVQSEGWVRTAMWAGLALAAISAALVAAARAEGRVRGPEPPGATRP